MAAWVAGSAGSRHRAATGSGQTPARRFTRRLLQNDPPLRRAVTLLGDPTQYAVEIRQAKRRAETQRKALEVDPNAPGEWKQE